MPRGKRRKLSPTSSSRGSGDDELAPDDQTTTATRVSTRQRRAPNTKNASTSTTPAVAKGRRGKSARLNHEDAAARLLAQVGREEDDDDDDDEDDEYADEYMHDVNDAAAANGLYANGGAHDRDDDDEDDDDTRGGRAEPTGFEAYFEQVSRRTKTSDNTLSRLPPMTRQEYTDLLAGYTNDDQVKQSAALMKAHVELYEEWALELEHGFNLCFHGYGSKKAVLEGLAEEEFAHVHAVIVDGYHPRADLRSLCGSITAGLGAAGNDVDAALRALDEYTVDEGEDDTVLLVIHNIDGEGLRTEKTQAAICRLVGHEKVKLICSIDHVKAPLMWSTSKLLQLGVIYHDATTLVPYDVETALLGGGSGDVFADRTKLSGLTGDRGIRWILQTLSQNARSIFRILLQAQIQTGSGLESSRLYQLSSEAFAVSNSTSFNAQLGEFLDHEIITVAREQGLGEVYRIPFEKEQLERLLEEIDAEGD
ncbi:Origin recognition complex subunit 2 [Savitreella phatthalungensis]